jgi:hypothetical protein
MSADGMEGLLTYLLNVEDLILLILVGPEDAGRAVLQSVGNFIPFAMP